MKVAILYESMFGNTEELARQVRTGLLDAGASVRTVEVGAAVSADFADLDLLVVAAPTHALTLSRPSSRAEAVAKGAPPQRALVGVREWLDDLEIYLPGTAARPATAVFDTRVEKARHWPGSAAGRAARGLRRAGFRVVDRQSFFVEGLVGPLTEGEGPRARSWACELVGRLAQDAERDAGIA